MADLGPWLAGLRRGLRGALAGPPAGSGVLENCYGHGKRLAWVRAHVAPGDRVLEVGCGTGLSITLPLARLGVDVLGLDLHGPSIEAGQAICREQGLDPARLRACRVEELAGTFDVIVCSEVLEHLEDRALEGLLGAMLPRLRPGGLLLVTVPNGRGWFELEHALYHRTRLGAQLESWWYVWPQEAVLRRLFGRRRVSSVPSSLDASPHVQSFSLRGLLRLLRRHGLRIDDVTGSTLCAGPITENFFSTADRLQKLNGVLGSLAPQAAAAFYVACRKAP